MIVIDASALIPMLIDLGTETNRVETGLEVFESDRIAAPHLIDLEVTHTVRRLVSVGQTSLRVAEGALSNLMEIRLDRYPHDLLLPRIWELRSSLSAYDAAYLALAEALEAKLLTQDRAMAVPDTSAEVIVIDWPG